MSVHALWLEAIASDECFFIIIIIIIKKIKLIHCSQNTFLKWREHKYITFIISFFFLFFFNKNYIITGDFYNYICIV